jgi:hypothetical protein
MSKDTLIVPTIVLCFATMQAESGWFFITTSTAA